MKNEYNAPLNHDVKAEFDLIAEEYSSNLQAAILITGEPPNFFAEYKVADCLEKLNSLDISSNTILDFGSGIGNSIPFFRKYFPKTNLLCAEISKKSMEISKNRFPGSETYFLIEDKVPIASDSVDVIFSACVFHHIPIREHLFWLSELMRVLKPGGILFIYEHNPLNPLTLRAVKNSPIDINAQLISANELISEVMMAGFSQPTKAYKLFFPRWFSKLRFLERYLDKLFLGAQYRVCCFKHSKVD